jgi:hypothetical protein
MQYIIPGILFFASLIVVLAFFNLRLSITLYLSYMILVPYLQFNVAGIPLSYNFVNLVLLFSFLYQWQKNKIKIMYSLIVPFIFLFLSLFVFIFFEWVTPIEIQYNNLRQTAMQTCIIPLIIFNFSKEDLKFLEYIKWALISSIFIACVYGIFLMKLNGFNPYTSFLSNYFHEMDAASILEDRETRLSFSSAKNIQSTMTHPMRWGLNLCFLIVIFIVVSLKEKKKWYWILIALIGFNVLISGVRTALATLAIVGIYYLFMKRDFKTVFIASIVVLSGYLIISANQDLSNIFYSFTDVKGTKSDVQGSSINGRLQQLEGCFNEIRGIELFGKGYGWTTYYMSIKEFHPIILSFESLLFVIICNHGYLGLFIWIIFFWLLFKLNRKMVKLKNDILYLDIIVLVYLIYAIGTGEYGYLQIFSIYYSFLFLYLFNHQHKHTSKK